MTALFPEANSSPVACFHCGAQVPAAISQRYAADLLGSRRQFCCAACRWVAQGIADAGLERFYQHREGTPTSPAPGRLEQDETAVFDREDVQAAFVSDQDGLASTHLALEGLHCAACGWLIEQRLRTLPGVEQAQVNLVARRLHLVWQRDCLPLSEVLHQLHRIGYTGRPWQADEAAEAQARETRSALKRLGVAGLLWFQTMMATMATWPEFNLDLTPELHAILRWAGFFLITPVVFYSCAPLFRGASLAVRAGRVSMDLSVALALGGAYGAGIYTTVSGTGELYFDAVGMFAFFLLAGRYLEARMRQRAAQGSAHWEARLPATSLRVNAQGETERVLLSELAVDDHVWVPVGATVPADGTVLEGQSRLDEALLTGEFKPCDRGPGESVSAGTLNLDQRLLVRVAALGEHSRLSTIARLVDRAQAHKPPLAQLADKVAHGFLLASLGAALLFGALWWWLDPAQAPWVVLAMLVATCPCALSLAIPTALTAALTNLQRRGVLITRGHVLEALPRIDTLLLDKTGTLTEGRPWLKALTPLADLAADDCLNFACALQHGSGHTLSHAFAPVALQADEVVGHPGLGLEGTVNGHRLRLGAAAWACEVASTTAPAMPDDQQQWLLLAGTQGPLAWFGLDDRLRADATALITRARELGWQVVMASGDRSPAVQRLGVALGIEAYGGLLPDHKLHLLEQLQGEGRTVLAVGDGSNDAPLLAQANVGVAMGQGTDLARTQADMVLLSNRLTSLTEALSLALRCRRVVLQNLGWAALYNGLVLPFAAAALITPAWAAVGMSFSSLLVVLNALRLAPPSEAQP